MAKVFISYSTTDSPIVDELRADLQQAGIEVWIDKVGLHPGTPDWDQALRDAIRKSDAILLAASPNSRRSPFVGDELALAEATKKPIFPVWIDGDLWIDSVPLGLGRRQHVDLRNDDSYAANLKRLVDTLLGVAQTIEPIVKEPLPEVSNPRNPYKGLRSFRASDSGDFFGRSTLVEELVAELTDIDRAARLLAVLGASGSGKSSVMMAGVLPQLQKQYPDWIYLDPIVPGDNPLDILSVALANQFTHLTEATIAESLTDRSTRGLTRLLGVLTGQPVVLYIDQFEELFTLVEKETDRRHFIDLITTAITDPNGNLTVLLSMRADFYDRPAAYRDFGNLIEKHHTLITPMTLANLYDVVQKPAQLPDVSVQFEDELVNEIVFAVREEVAALPLLQFTLEQLFEKRVGNLLTLDAYEAIGGIQGALARHAESTYAGLSSKKHQDMARSLFLRLIEPGQTEQDTTRRRASYSELTLSDADQTQLMEETARYFVDARLLVSDQSHEGRTLEVSHEALIREWARLGEWLHDAREDLRIQKNISTDAREWFERRKPQDMLYRGTVLDRAIKWSEANQASNTETLFIKSAIELTEELKAKDAARQEREDELATRAERQERAARNFRRASVILLFIFVLAVGAGIFAAISALDAQNEGNIASTQISEAEAQILELENIAPGATQGAQWFNASSNVGDQYRVDFARQGAPVPILTNNEWGSPIVREFNDIQMVLVPAGCFMMGSEDGSSDETPVHEQCFDKPFWIDRYEVTNENYGSVGCEAESSEPNQPRNCVNWFDARDYCEARGARLPTEPEWEYAARGPDNLVYTWGNIYNSAFVVNSAFLDDGISQVGSRPEGASWVGALDMIGNVSEWTSSLYGDYEYSNAYEDSDNTEDVRVWRGGLGSENFLRVAKRFSSSPLNVNLLIGFRCASDFILVPVEGLDGENLPNRFSANNPTAIVNSGGAELYTSSSTSSVRIMAVLDGEYEVIAITDEWVQVLAEDTSGAEVQAWIQISQVTIVTVE